MAEETLTLEKNDEQAEGPQYGPGVLIGVEVSYRDTLDFTEAEKNAITQLVSTLSQRDMPARREEVVRIWEKRLFDRGFQHLLPLRTGGWEIPQIGSGYGPGEPDSRSIFETNIYNSYNQILISALTREYPKPDFEACDPNDDADITAAHSADRIIDYINRGTRIMTRQAELARYLCIDGRAVTFSQYILDGQQYGYETEKEEDEDAEPQAMLTDGVVPEDEEQADAEDLGAEESSETEGESGEEADTEIGDESEGTVQGKPNGRQITTVLGALETKFPIKANCLAECGYAQISVEIDVQIARAQYPDVAEEIQPSSGGPGGDDIDRLARINVKLGVFDNFVTTDSQVYDVTKQITWMRPAQLLELAPKEIRDSILAKTDVAKYGLRVVYCGPTFCEARALSMDEQLTVMHALPGDGMHRPGFADWLMPIQKVVNNWSELLDDYIVRGVPNKWMDNEMFNVQALREQTNIPGATHPFEREPGVQMSEVIWEETPLEVPAVLPEIIKFYILDLAQLLTGAVPALSGGGDASPTDTFGGMLVQRDQAIGRLGIPWRNMKEGLANAAAQDVRCFAHNNERAIKLTGNETVTIEMQQLRTGNFLAFPVTDENFPEAPTQKANRLALLIQDATTNPIIGQLLDDPSNLEEVLQANGMDLSVEAIESRDKQLGEFVELLQSGPVPNPKIAQLEEMAAPLQEQLALVQQAATSGVPVDPQKVAPLAAQLKQITDQIAQIKQSAPLVSTVEIAYFDNDAVELATCKKLLRSPRGRELRDGTAQEQAAYQNIELHGKEHEAAGAQKAAAQGAQAKKPPSFSANVKDLPPKEAAQVMEQGGIKSSPQDFVAAEAADAAEKHPGPGGITIQ